MLRGLFILLLLLSLCGLPGLPAVAAPLVGEPLSPLPGLPTLDPSRVELGLLLFNEKRLSRGHTISCASCHDLNSNGATHLRVDEGFAGHPQPLNTPTVFNSALNFLQFWDGRAPTLEKQLGGPLTNPNIMAGNWAVIVDDLKHDALYVERFANAYPDGITEKNISDALSTFERSLVTSNSRFDQYLLGNAGALTAREKKGYERFKSFGCVACHQGAGVGGNMFQTMGVMGDYFRERGTPETTADLGRFNVTHKNQDKHVFKVPSLRNVALTAPYFHDGSAPTLKDAVRTMAKYQLGRQISEADLNLIVEFLGTLTGEKPASLRSAGGPKK